MLHLDDLLHHNETSLQLHYQADPKETFLPELREIVDHKDVRNDFDPFFDSLHSHLPSSTFSQQQSQHLPSEELPALLKTTSEVQRAKTTAKIINKNKNQTKNIPKNFGKGIISFIERNKSKLSTVIESYGFNYDDVLDDLRQLKQKINTIAELRELWTGPKGTCMRVLSNLFFRKYALQYIFNSRISSYSSHIKYRGSLWKALEQPLTFNRIKEY